MGKSSPPPPPNFQAIADAQGVLDRAAVREQTYANRPDQFTPFGSMQFEPATVQDPTTGELVTKFSQIQTVDPQLQQTIRDQLATGSQRASIAKQINERVGLGQSYLNPVDYGQFRDVGEVGDIEGMRQSAEEAAYSSATSRLNPQFEQLGNDLNIRLRNQGLRPGDEAYDREVANFQRGRTDAYQRAREAAVQTGRAEQAQTFGQQQTQQAQTAALRRQEIGEKLEQRGIPLRDINELLAGQGLQPATQTAPIGFTAAGSAQAPQLNQAAQNQFAAQQQNFNAQQAQQQGLMSGIGSAASAALMFSDPRLKTEVKFIGQWRNTPYPAYTFKYRGSGKTYVGVRSDQINPDAVETGPAGLDVVNYERIA